MLTKLICKPIRITDKTSSILYYIILLLVKKNTLHRVVQYQLALVITSKEPVCPRVELILKIIIILLIIFLGFIKNKPC